jgi:hypothetical protein
MSFETVSLLLNWAELGTLLAILFRLAHMFDLIANTQRELRRAIHHLGERCAGGLGVSNAFGASGTGSVPSTLNVRAVSESTTGADDLPLLPF